MCSSECALTATIRRLDGSCRSSRSWPLLPSSGFTMQQISVPPEVSWTHEVSGRRASASATAAAASGTHCSLTTHLDSPIRCESGTADHADHGRGVHPPVAPGHGLLGGAGHRGDAAERRPGHR